MYRTFRQSLFSHIGKLLQDKFQVQLSRLNVEEPPTAKLGDYALPVAFELARTLRMPPRKIAEQIVAAIGNVPGFSSFEVAGAGYINCKLDRSGFTHELAHGKESLGIAQYDVGVEHTSINPNKAAHIGHLRNAILGDTFARMLRVGPDDDTPNNVWVQNYIDNTGVQVADIVVALMHLRQLDLAGVRRWMTETAARNERIDYACWNLYANVSQWYEADPEQKDARKKIRLDTLHRLEAGGNETSAIAELVSTAIVRRHLETMQRLGIEYDFLPRESEILHLKFWDAAFALMKEKGVLYKENQGKNKGCWVMRRAGTEGTGGDGPDEDAKVIVRSNGTVTYVGKDIAYHLWKFGKLPGKNFSERPFYTYRDGKTCEISCMPDTADPAVRLSHFGKATVIYNVIDSRQADPQNNVIEALRGMGFAQEAKNYHHFSYEMVALTPRCAAELGYEVSDEDKQRPYIEVSGRKGFGVKADDLIDKLIQAALEQVDARHPDRDAADRRDIAQKIAVGALRYYMLRYTRTAVIAFDFRDALSFEGETGPYAQYAVVRAANIFRKAGVTAEQSLLEFGGIDSDKYLFGDEGDSIWELWLLASKSMHVLERCIQTTEPAYLAKHVFQLAQQFSNFYHRHPILTETDPARKTLLLATVAIAQRELIRALGWMGIDVPEVM